MPTSPDMTTSMESAWHFTNNRVLRFGAFEVDLRTGELRRSGAKIKVQQQPFRVLALLLEHPGEVVTREELRQAIWPGRFVEFNEGLDEAMYKLRSALGDSAETPRFVETLPRRGYRFIGGPVTVVTPEAPGRLAGFRRWSLAFGVGLVGLLVLVALVLAANPGGLRDRLRGRGAEAPIHSIAVLPLRDLSGDSTQQYFAEGMTEALVTSLGKVSGLRVISHTSTMRYKATHEALPAIARQLDVDAVVEGAVLRSGKRLRVTAQLIEASTDRHLWAETYERDLHDVVDLQDEIARAITSEVQMRLSAPEHGPVPSARSRPVNPEAYDLYLKGRHEWNEWTEPSLKKSVEYFEQVVEKDSGYAPGWAGLSDAYSLLGLFGFLPSEVALSNARAAALKAIDLDEGLSEAHVSLAGVRLHLEWAWSAAEAEMRRAIALNPNNAMAHQWHGYILSARGQFDSAVAEMKRALELDPLSPNKRNSLAATFYRAGRYDEALRYFREVPDPDANSETRHQRIAAIYERQGRQKEAIAEWLTALRLAGKKALAASVERAYLTSDYPEAKRTLLWGDIQDAQRRARNAYPRPLASEVAADYALLGEKDRAFEWLERAFREREGTLMYLNVDIRLEALRSDTRFRDLARRMGLLPEVAQ